MAFINKFGYLIDKTGKVLSIFKNLQSVDL